MSEVSTRREGVLTTGERLGRYEIISLLARGGMGAVYLARSEGANGFTRLFAVKVMHPHLADEEEFVHMLVDEARVASRIHHPNAVAIVDLAESPHGYYLAMDYVDGVTLTQMRRSTRIADEMKTRIGLRIVLDALAGLHSAHELTDDDGVALGIVHRDVSPHNVLIGTDGVGRITDFGIALAASRITASRPGMIKGKPQYMAPEQVIGERVDRRADVFCAGIILWEFLTRGRLFQADTESAAMMMVHKAPIAIPSSVLTLPAGFDAVCMKALERDPSERYPTARAFADALAAVTSDAGWLLSPNDVAEQLTAAFADEIAQRKALIREHGKGSMKPAREAVKAPAAEPSALDSFQGGATIAMPPREDPSRSAPRVAPPKETSHSIPAIEVSPAKPGAVTTKHVSLVPRESLRPSRVVPVAAFLVGGLVVAAWLTLRTPASQAPQRPSQLASPVPASTPVREETPAPVREAPPTPSLPVVAPVVPAVIVAPVVPAVIAAPADTAPRRRRARGADAGVASAPSTTPALETNPYLRH